MSDANKEWEEREQKVLDEIGRCINHMFLGLFSSNKAEALHAQILQFVAKKVTLTQTHSLALSLRNDGLYLIINADYFLNELKTTEERMAALRHEENHLFLRLPFRCYRYKHILIDNKLSDDTYEESKDIGWSLELFRALCDFECSQFISGYVDLKDGVTREAYPNLNIQAASSVEQLYAELYPSYKKLQDNMLEAANNFEKFDDGPLLMDLYQLLYHSGHSDHQHWDGEQFYDEDGIPTTKMVLSHYEYKLLENELERIFVTARESLPFDKAAQLGTQLHKKIDGYLANRNLSRTDPAVADEAEAAVSRILNHFTIYDPFFGQFLLGCVRQLTDTISTAGVALLKRYVLLLINPHFFINVLKDDKERGAVLKHEALHIILKHVIQMHNPKYTLKRLYNIAADLEVNQYIGGKQWKLPDSALSIHRQVDA